MKSGIDSERINARSTEVFLEAQNLNLELAREEGTNHAGNVHEHGEDLKQNGPNLNKSRPTWTRLSRMDCGLNENKKSGTSTSLGKRSLVHESEQDHAEGMEIKQVKRGKVQNDSQDSKAAGALERPCRAQ